ncbi:MAG: hypothetical protein NTY77_07185 [Elusimicrobia bacterium]|nr:hypothetical protein [Elusimicrobiota bacterium]
MNGFIRALAFWLLLPQAAFAGVVVELPKVALPIGQNAAGAALQVQAPRSSLSLTPSWLAAAKPAPILSPVPVVVQAPAIQVLAPGQPILDQAGASISEAAPQAKPQPAAETDKALGAGLFDGQALRVDSLDAVLDPGAGSAIAATPRGARVRLEAGKKLRLVIEGEGRKDVFLVRRDSAGLSIRKSGALRGRRVPEKGFYIFRGPTAHDGADRFTIPDRSLPEARMQAAVSVEDGWVLIQDAGAITLHKDGSVRIEGARPEGSFPIQKALSASGHVFSQGAIRYLDETVAVDWDRDAALRGFYERVKASLAARRVGGDELAALSGVFAAVAREVKYDEAAVTARLSRLGGKRGVLLGELMGLSGEDSCPAVGVCRHMALLLGSVLERLIQEGQPGLSSGQVYYVGGKGHAWAVYRDADGGYHVLDAAQRHDEVPLQARTSYSGTDLDSKGEFSYADDMTPEMKRDWQKSLPSKWSEAADSLSGLVQDAASRLRRLLPDRGRDEAIRRRLAAISAMGREDRTP